MPRRAARAAARLGRAHHAPRLHGFRAADAGDERCQQARGPPPGGWVGAGPSRSVERLFGPVTLVRAAATDAIVSEGAAQSGAKLFACRPRTPSGEPRPGL